MTNDLWSSAEHALFVATTRYGKTLEDLERCCAQKPLREGTERDQWRREYAKARAALKFAQADFKAASDALLNIQELNPREYGITELQH